MPVASGSGIISSTWTKQKSGDCVWNCNMPFLVNESMLRLSRSISELSKIISKLFDVESNFSVDHSHGKWYTMIKGAFIDYRQQNKSKRMESITPFEPTG